MNYHLHDRSPERNWGRVAGVMSTGYTPDILYTIEDVRNIKDGVRIFYKDTKAADPWDSSGCSPVF